MKLEPIASETRTLKVASKQVENAVRSWTDEILQTYSFASKLTPNSKAMLPLKVEWSSATDVKIDLKVMGIASTVTTISWRKIQANRTEVTIGHRFGVGSVAQSALPGVGFGEAQSRAAINQAFAQITSRIQSRSLDG